MLQNLGYAILGGLRLDASEGLFIALLRNSWMVASVGIRLEFLLPNIHWIVGFLPKVQVRLRRFHLSSFRF